eukprot:s207_g14.t1
MLRLLVCLVCHALAGPLILEPDFELVSFTPEDGKILTGRQALTAVFSLAVLPLGADFGDGPPPEELQDCSFLSRALCSGGCGSPWQVEMGELQHRKI